MSTPTLAGERAREVLRAALGYAKNGFYVIPWRVIPNGAGRPKKLPAIKRWQLSEPPAAPPDVDRVHAMWGPGGTHEGLNVGILTGWRWKEGGPVPFAAYDIDVADGRQGAESWARLMADLQMADRDTATLTATTPTAGRHFLFDTREPVGTKSQALEGYPDLDTRGVGGYIGVWPSLVNGAGYEWTELQEPSLMPEALEQKSPRPGRAKPDRETQKPIDGVDPQRAKARALAYVGEQEGAKEGSRGSTAYKLAARIKNLGCDEDTTFDLLRMFWADRCDPPMPDEDLTDSVQHAFRYSQDPQGSAAIEAIFPPLPESPSLFESTPKRRSIEALDVLDLMNTDPKPVPWLARPFFPAVDFGILASKSGHGKSFLALQISVAIATGLPFLGAEVVPGGAGILSLEDGPGTIQRRLHAIRKSYGFAWTEEHARRLVANLRIMVRRPPDASTKSQALELATMAKELAESMETTEAKAAVLFLDTLNMIHDGDENSSTETRPLIAAIFGIHDRLKCSVWAIHHIRKAGLGRNAPSLADRIDPELLRGSSALVASARAISQLGWVTSREAAKVGLDEDEAATRYAVLALTKANDAPKSPWAFLEHAEDGGTWRMHPRGDTILAQLKNGLDASDLGRAEKILLDLHAGITDRDTLKENHWPGDEKSADKLKSVLSDMRRRTGWLEKGSVVLTKKGLEKVQEIQGEIQRQANARTAADLFGED